MTNHVVWKKILFANPVVQEVVTLPVGSKLLHFNNQDEQFCLWFECNPSSPLVERKFELVGTGHPFDSEGKTYIGTALMSQGAFVFHLYEVV